MSAELIPLIFTVRDSRLGSILLTMDSLWAELADYSTAPDLTAREVEVLDFLLSAELPDADALRQQAASARLLDKCPCGCASVHLVVDPEAPTATAVSPIAMVVSPATGAGSPELILRIRDGRLERLEIDCDRVLHDTFPAPDTLHPPVAIHPG
jgi:hypothetical protein